jgi:hypothetical protein
MGVEGRHELMRKAHMPDACNFKGGLNAYDSLAVECDAWIPFYRLRGHQ